MAAGNEMRVSDAEREAAAAELQEHFASGRLDQDELDERLTAAFAAKTRGDLSALFADLPSSGRDWSDAPGGVGRSFTGHGESRPDRPQPGWHYERRRVGAAFAAVASMMAVLTIFGVLSVFGIGGARPIGIVLLVAAFALLRRLLFMIFGRRGRGGRGGGPRRRGGRRR